MAMKQETMKLGVLLSGAGSNLQAIIDAIAKRKLKAQIELVISSKPDTLGLKRAHLAGIATIGLTPEVYRDQKAADELIAAEMIKAKVDYIVMAGYMRKVTAPILEAFKDRVLNIHPALLPAFPGAHAIEDAYNAGVKITGVTVHFANEVYDEGPIISQAALVIESDESLASLTSRIHEIEHRLYPQCLKLLAQNKVTIDKDRKVHVAQ